jgi:HEAT repeat protein
MKEFEGTAENQIKKWRSGAMDTAELRSLPTSIGRDQYQSGIPILLELATHEDEIVRYNAVMSLSFKLHYQAAKDLFCSILQKDPDEDCRDAAAGGLGYLFDKSKECTLIRVLGTACFSDPDEDVRRSAYAALLRVSGLADETLLYLQTGPRPPVNERLAKEVLAGC